MQEIIEIGKTYDIILDNINRDFPINETERVVGAENYLLNIILSYDGRGKSLESHHIRGICGEIMFEVLINYYRNYNDNFKLFKNLILPLDDGGTTQLDFVIVSPQSIIVVESKSLFGDITINEETVRTSWITNNGEEQFREFKPWNQNLLHIIALKKYLNINNLFIHNAVFMFGAGIINQVTMKEENFLMTLSNTMDMLDYLLCNKREGRIIPKKDMKTIINKLTLAIPTVQEEYEHVRHLKRKYN